MVQAGVHTKSRKLHLHLPQHKTSQSQPHQGRRSAPPLHLYTSTPLYHQGTAFQFHPNSSDLSFTKKESLPLCRLLLSPHFFLFPPPEISPLSCSWPSWMEPQGQWTMFFQSASWGFKGAGHQGEELWDNPPSSPVPGEFVGLWTVKYSQCVSPSSALPCKGNILVCGTWRLHSQ